MIRIKRVYEAKDKSGGKTFLVDRLWPRGISKSDIALDGWLKEVAPSNELRLWFHHEPERWGGFENRYRQELDSKPETWEPILEAARKDDITLLYSAKDIMHNNAIILKEYIEERLK